MSHRPQNFLLLLFPLVWVKNVAGCEKTGSSANSRVFFPFHRHPLNSLYSVSPRVTFTHPIKNLLMLPNAFTKKKKCFFIFSSPV